MVSVFGIKKSIVLAAAVLGMSMASAAQAQKGDEKGLREVQAMTMGNMFCSAAAKYEFTSDQIPMMSEHDHYDQAEKVFNAYGLSVAHMTHNTFKDMPFQEFMALVEETQVKPTFDEVDSKDGAERSRFVERFIAQFDSLSQQKFGRKAESCVKIYERSEELLKAAPGQ